MFAESDETRNLPKKVLIFVDELNKYAPAGVKDSPLIEQILDISERGRSLGVILLSAQQFMSAVHPRVTGNAATKILGRSTSSEIMQPDYRFLDQDLKLSVTRLSKVSCWFSMLCSASQSKLYSQNQRTNRNRAPGTNQNS